MRWTPPQAAEGGAGTPQMATISEYRYRWLRLPDLNRPFDGFLSLGGRSEEISQIRVVWGKAVALSRYQRSPTHEGAVSKLVQAALISSSKSFTPGSARTTTL